MITPFSKFQTVEDIRLFLEDRESVIIPVCDNTLFVMRKILDPRKDEFLTFGPDDATVVGIMVKIYKLTEAIVDAYKNNKLELICIYSRLIFEAYIKMRYLIDNGVKSQREYRLSSYKGRLEMYNEHLKNPNPVSEVMVRKFLSDIKEEGITINEIESAPKKAFGGKNFRQILKEVGAEELYTSQYSILSDSIHSDWGETRQLYMYVKDGRYAAKIDDEIAHYRTVIPNIHTALTATKDYISWASDLGYTELKAFYGLVCEFIRVVRLISKSFIEVYQNTPETYMME